MYRPTGGIFELRRFFTTAVDQENRKHNSKEGVKAEIAQIIGELESKGQKFQIALFRKSSPSGASPSPPDGGKYRSELGK